MVPHKILLIMIIIYCPVFVNKKSASTVISHPLCHNRRHERARFEMRFEGPP